MHGHNGSLTGKQSELEKLKTLLNMLNSSLTGLIIRPTLLYIGQTLCSCKHDLLAMATKSETKFAIILLI